jgi:hypothetical protein
MLSYSLTNSRILTKHAHSNMPRSLRFEMAVYLESFARNSGFYCPICAKHNEEHWVRMQTSYTHQNHLRDFGRVRLRSCLLMFNSSLVASVINGAGFTIGLMAGRMMGRRHHSLTKRSLRSIGKPHRPPSALQPTTIPIHSRQKRLGVRLSQTLIHSLSIPTTASVIKVVVLPPTARSHH